MKSIFITTFLIATVIGYESTKPCFSQTLNQTLNIFPKKEKESISNIVAEIGMYKTVDSRAVGFSGMKSDQYKRFERLVALTPDSLLIKLTDHFNANVKAYAFMALVNKRDPMIKAILEKHLSDVQTFQFLGGCVGETRNINEWFLQLAKDDLTEEEVRKYSAIILK